MYIFTTFPVTAAVLGARSSFLFFVFFLFRQRCGFGFCAVPELKPKRIQRNNAEQKNGKSTLTT